MEKIKEFFSEHGREMVVYIAVFVAGCAFGAITTGAAI